jgi:hypothetical protein
MAISFECFFGIPLFFGNCKPGRIVGVLFAEAVDSRGSG